MSRLICGACGYQTESGPEGIAFCAKCGARLQPAMGVREEIALALLQNDLSARYEMLLKIREKFPDTYAVEFEILVIGRMHERGGKPDFYRIPFWPLSVFETPAQYKKKEQAKMLNSFFENPEAHRVCALSEDRDAFWKDYYFRMARGYVDICLKGKYETTSIFGFRRKNNDVMKRCAPQLVKMLANIEKAEYPDRQHREILADAMKRAFVFEFEADGAQAYLEENGIS